MKKINIVLPVYNEECGIERFHLELLKILAGLKNKYRFEIIYVADKCKDGTLNVLRKIFDSDKNITVISLSRRFGHQISLVAGIDHSDGDAMIMMDCDLEHPPELIPKLLEQFERGYDIVNTKREYSKKISFLKKFTSGLYYKVLNFLSSEPLDENSADFRLLSKKVIDVYRTSIREHNQYLRGLISWMGFSQITVPFISGIRISGKSNYRFKEIINFAVYGIISFSKVPLRISITLGFFTTITGLIYGVYGVIKYFVSKIPIGWTSTVTCVIIFGGIQLIVMGVIGEYIAGIFDEVKNRPLYIIDQYFSKTKKHLKQESLLYKNVKSNRR
jgi:polyisoprenyl-phosphate glycosyltransferase